MSCLISEVNSSPKYSKEEWDKLPESVKAYIQHLEGMVSGLFKLYEKIKTQLEKAEAKLNRTSRNSSKPPSSDSPYDRGSEKETKKKNKGKAGGKPGHKGHKQKLLEPTSEEKVVPEQCECGNKEFDEIKPFYTHQEIELPEIEMLVIHFILHQGKCTCCGKVVKAKVPEEHSTGYGPRLSSLIGNMAGIEGNSRSTTKDFCESVLKFPISLGAIQKVIDRVSEAIKPIYERIGEIARSSAVNGVDETSWREKGQLRWLWTLVNPMVAFFMVHAKRSRQAFEALIGDWQGILISDGYKVYQKWVNLRQTCLAHLIRDARGLAELLRVNIADFGKTALELLQTLCKMAHAPPDEKTWNTFYTQLLDLIFDNLDRKDDAGKFARRLLRELDSLWIFLEVAGVEPTNNRSERVLRFGVLWRKRSQGTRGDKGNRWVERILSLRQTARLRNKSSYDIIVNAVSCYFKGRRPNLSWLAKN